MRTEDLDDNELESSAKMSFLDHLDELRRRLIISISAVGIGFVACFSFAEKIYDFLAVPITQNLSGAKLVYTNPTDPFTIYMKVALLAAVFLFIPGAAFGQREHLLALLFVPWFMLRAVRSQGAQISVTGSAFVGLLAAVAVCLKPHAILAPIAIEALLLWSSRNLRAVFVDHCLRVTLEACTRILTRDVAQPNHDVIVERRLGCDKRREDPQRALRNV